MCTRESKESDRAELVRMRSSLWPDSHEGEVERVLRTSTSEGIVIVDLRRWIPEQVNFNIRTLQATERCIHLWLVPGSVEDLPPGTVKSLPSGN